jgi:acyl transferase domain-containing protein/NAD(P)-dependent dehydrogenase (short-subunit alcohol dehydrogenase family)
MKQNGFDVLVHSPAAWTHPGVAVAAARAGGVGVLDLEFSTDAALAAAHFARLLSAVDGRIGLRVTPETLAAARAILEAAPRDRDLVLIAAGPVSGLGNLVSNMRASRVGANDSLWLELNTADADISGIAADGIIARGFEAPGWGGEDSAYILVQKLLRATSLPIMVRGGIGIHSAGAVRAAGAAGVVLDDQVLLMDESPLPAALKAELARLNGSETRIFGEFCGAVCRGYVRSGAPALKAAEAALREAEGEGLDADAWRQRFNPSMGWGEGQLIPVGQGVGVAANALGSLKRVGRLVQAIQKQSFAAMREAAGLGHLADGAPMAQAHGTRYPLAQGPMTRVSDNADFAVSVTEGGALPFLALALMRGNQVDELLAETAAKMGDRPWGVGLLGFVPQALREEQCAAIWKHKPPFALIAGGRPDQAAAFEERGIPSYIHVPAPQLLKMYLEQGARRFVFEGRECGGHIGPIASFPLWEQMIEVLLAEVPAKKASEVHVFFAGGISDARSGAMLAVLTAKLAAHGIRVGALMGTAYLFTREIVESGAIVQGFQDEAIACRNTQSLETGPGHSTRCADTAFARDFHALRRQLIAEGVPAEEIRDRLEDLNLGRLRLASKGRTRDDSGQIIEIDAERQKAEGMYMIGQVATLRDAVTTVPELHADVCDAATAQLAAFAEEVEARAEAAKPSDIAIVGIGMLLPKAGQADEFWENVLHKVNVITEVPRSRWDWRLYYDPDRDARDKVYSKWGGFLDEINFDPTRFGIPPRSMKSIDPMQLLSLECTARALDDAGLGDDFDRENTSIILGAGGGVGDLGMQYGVRSELPRFVQLPDDGAWDRLPEWTNESFAGVLQNVAAGRVANRLDFGGVNFTVDAACGSSLAAVTLAVQELETGRSNVAIAGGVDTVQGPFGFLCFSKTQALSPQGVARTFDKNADGIVISEGVAMVVMKRLADAERDGDRIYAVIKAAAGSSDGKALGMTAPRPEGQMRALTRAYGKAGFGPESLGCVEAHGTGTPVGDRAEAETITRTLKAYQAPPRSVAIGSIKTILGHTKCAAGVSGLIKMALSLHHRVLPAHVGVDNPIEPIAESDSPVYLLKEPRPWLATPGQPRRAGVSAFGFGGTNFHAVLEEYRGGFGAPEVPGARHWPFELISLRAKSPEALAENVGRLVTALRQGTNVSLSELAWSIAIESEKLSRAPVAAAFAVKSVEDLTRDLDALLAHLQQQRSLPPHIRYRANRPAEAPPVAFLFPGQGAQQVNMGCETALYIEELRSAVEHADAALADRFDTLLSRRMWPEAAFGTEAEGQQRQAITDTRVAQPAIGALSSGYLAFARRMGIEAQAVAGHSYGEYTALYAAGVIDAETFLHLSAVRGAAMAAAANSATPGGMAAVQARREAVEPLLTAFEGVIVANHNAPEQTVISGPLAGIEAAVEALGDKGLRATRLPVSGAFHTELVAGAKAPLSAAIAAADFRSPTVNVYSNTTGAAYPAEPDAIRAQIDQHLLSPVEFVREIEAMADAGARVFLELGPRGICSNMAAATLAGREGITTVSLDGQGGGLRGLMLGLADLICAGLDVPVTRLYENRGLKPLQLSRLAELVRPLPLPKTTWFISGGCARPLDDPKLRMGKETPLDLEQVEAAQRKAAEAPAPIAPAALPGVMPAVAAAAPLAPAMAGDALVAYQQTMRQFLELQERVISQYLGTAPGAASALPSMPMPQLAAPIAAPAPAAVGAPVAAAAPQPEAPVAVASTPAVSLATITTALVALVAERTGYPEDMIALDADLEADLGVDSIKRVEIVGAFQKTLPDSVAQAMQVNLESYTRARSLQALLDALAPHLASLPVAAPTASPVAANAPAAVVFDARGALVALVAERTGYPEDMITLDADLEADLGIDSIKRVEIVGAFQKLVPEAMATAMQADLESFTRARTLEAVLAALPAQAAAPAAALTSPAAVPAAVSFDARGVLVALVAERTGYPEDMIALDADLEADLGIDSIKRVEIVGAFQKLVPEAMATAMQADLESFTRARTLEAVLSALPAAQSMPAAAAAPIAAVPAAAAAFDARAVLVALVAERTGYPEDMIALDADLEADLGIDSIKRVEIVGAFQKVVPEAVAAAMQADLEQYTRARSLDMIIGLIDSLGATPAPAAMPVAAIAPTVAESEQAADDDVARYVVRPREIAPPSSDARISGTVLVLAATESDPVAAALIAAVEARGGTPKLAVAASAEAVHKAVLDARAGLTGVILLHGLTEVSDLGQAHAVGAQTVFAGYQTLRALGEDCAQIRLIAATRLGGTFGRDAIGPGSPIAGGLVGLLNCARHEYPEAHFLPVDFNGQSDTSIATHLAAELAARDRLPEVGYVGDARYTVTTVSEPLSDTPFAPHLEPQGDWVVLATGGARGITASILREMVRPGMTLVLAGRSPEPAPEDAALAAAADAAALKRTLLEQARARGETPKPADIERALGKVLAEREIRTALADLRAAGAKVDYRACDVRDGEAFSTLINQIYADHGRIDAVLHGAGVIEDKLLVDKTPESFARVFGTKIDSSITLARVLKPDSLKLLVFFTSVAGRYGNKGQSDYAAANEAVNRLAWQLSRQWSDTRVMAMNWGPWDAGMASEGVKRQFRERGIIPIPLAAGCRYFVRELGCGPRHEVELVIGEGPWQEMEGHVQAVAPAPATGPLLRQPLRMGAGGALVLTQTINVGSDPWLGDHRIDGKPVVPAAAAIEWMAQVADAGWAGWQVAEVRDVRVLSGVTLENEEANLVVRARASSHSGAGEQMLSLEIIDPARGNKALYRAAVKLVERLPEAPPELPSGISGKALEATEAYRKYLFHGPAFRLMADSMTVSTAGIDAALRGTSPQGWGVGGGEWLFDPGVLDCAPQLAIIWSRIHGDRTALPTAFGSIRRYGSGPLGEGLRLLYRARPAPTEASVAYDAWVVDAKGQVRMVIEGAEGTASAALNRLVGA